MSNFCEHKHQRIAQRADQTAWHIYCADCNLHGDKARTLKSAKKKWQALLKAQAAWRVAG